MTDADTRIDALNPSRRELFAGIAAAAAFSQGPAVLAREKDAPAEFYRIVADDGVHGRAFADEARRLGGPAAVSASTVSDLWARDLYFKWKLGREPIAGLTEHHVWFLLDQMANSAGLRTVYRTHHLPSASGQVAHEIFGTRQQMAHRASLNTAGRAWPFAAARLVMASPPGAPVDRTRSTIARAGELSLAPTTLISWIIAAPARA